LIAVYKHEHLGYLAPGPEGRMVFTTQAGRLDVDGKPIGRAELRTPTPLEPIIPSSDPTYYLTIGGLPLIDSFGGHFPAASEGNQEVTASVHAADGTRLLTVHGLDEMAGLPSGDRRADNTIIPGDFTLDKRFHLIPPAGLLITIPATNDRLVLRRLDLAEALDRAGGDYLVVVSPTTLTASPGQRLEHQIVARARRGGITCTLSHGPAGLSVTPDGKVTWLVTGQAGGEDVTAEIAVRDAASQERVHRLQICVK
jgi:hypothetical protein